MVMFRDSSNKKRQLKGGQPFLLYWQKEGGTDFYPLALREGKDMIFKEEISRNDIVQFMFDLGQQDDVTSMSASHRPLLYRVGGGGWSWPSQRKGTHYYLASAGSGNDMRRVRKLVEYPDGVHFALQMNIDYKGDAWISWLEHTDSIRMQVSDDRAYLVAVRHGDAFDDALGETSTFSKRTQEDLIDSD